MAAAKDAGFDMRSAFPFSPLLDEREGAIARRNFTLCEIPAGTTLWREGDPGHSAAYVVKGRVEVKKETEFANKYVIIGLYGENSFVGELGLFSGGNYAATATTLTDVTLLEIAKNRFDELFEEDPVIAGKLLKGMLLGVSGQLKKSFERLVTIF